MIKSIVNILLCIVLIFLWWYVITRTKMYIQKERRKRKRRKQGKEVNLMDCVIVLTDGEPERDYGNALYHRRKIRPVGLFYWFRPLERWQEEENEDLRKHRDRIEPYFEILSSVVDDDILIRKKNDHDFNVYMYCSIYFCILEDMGLSMFFRTISLDYIRKLRNSRKKGLPIPIPLKDFKKHTHILGSTGSGKSELLKLIFYDIQLKSEIQKQKKISLVLIDPHGDIANQLKRLNSENTIYIEPSPDWAKGKTPIINPFDVTNKSDTNVTRLSQELSNGIAEALADTSEMSGNMKTLLEPCIYTLIKHGNTSLIDLQDFMHDSTNEKWLQIGKQSEHPTHKNIFNAFSDSLYKPTRQSIFIKLQRLLNSSEFFHLTTGKSTINIEKELNEGKTIIFNLSKGKLGTYTAQAFGRMIIALIQAVALNRQKIPESQRPSTFLFIDECQNFVSPSYTKILEESRKYGLHFVLAHQTLSQLKSNTIKAIQSNTAVKMVGYNEVDTLATMAKQLRIEKDKMLEIPDFHFYIKAGKKPAILAKVPNFLVLQPKKTNTFYHSETDSLTYKKIVHNWIKTYYRDISGHKEANTGVQTENDNDNESPQPKFNIPE